MNSSIPKTMLTNKLLIEAVQILDSTFKGYSSENIKTLLNTYDYNECLAYIKVDKFRKRKDISLEVGKMKVKITKNFVAMNLGKGYQITNHTLFTFLTEFNINPSDVLNNH